MSCVDLSTDELLTLINALEISIPHSESIGCKITAEQETTLRERLIDIEENL